MAKLVSLWFFVKENERKSLNRVEANIPSRRRFPNSPVYGGNGSLSTSMGRPVQKSETKKNSVFQFLSEVTKDLISL